MAKERKAKLCLSYAAVAILPPHVKKGAYENKPIHAWAVRVWEESPPAQGTKLEWFLVCLDAVTTAEQAWEKSDWYGCRWIEEEYHKAQKMGCQIEALQFRTEQALQQRWFSRLADAVAWLAKTRKYGRWRPDRTPATQENRVER